MTTQPIASSQSASRPLEPYRKFVDDDSDAIDLIDSVAYVLYKQRKLDFVKAFTGANSRAPTAQEMESFVLAQTLPASVESFKATATETLRSFSEGVLSEAEAEVEERYKRQLVEELTKARPFLRTLAENILANLGAVAVLAIILLLIYGSRIGVAGLVGDVFGYDIKERPISNQVGPSLPAPR